MLSAGVRLVAAALAAAAVAAAALAALAWSGAGRERSLPDWGPVGTPVAVLLTNGQVYYGELAGRDAGHLRLVDVYYVQTVASADTGQPSNQLVNRSRADWHGPTWMSIPAERIVFVEGIGANSRLADLMAQEKKLAPVK